jgi:hypothetical protein
LKRAHGPNRKRCGSSNPAEIGAQIEALTEALNAVLARRRKRTAFRRERIQVHKFTVGQCVELVATEAQQPCAANYVIIRLVANDDGDPKYRVKSSEESQERIIEESRLTLTQKSVGGGGTRPDIANAAKLPPG